MVVDSVIAKLYESIVDPPYWFFALCDLIALSRSKAASFYVKDYVLGAISSLWNWIHDFTATPYVQHYHDIDPSASLMLTFTSGMYCCCGDNTEKYVSKREYYQNSYLPQIRYFSAGVYHTENYSLVLATHRFSKQEMFDRTVLHSTQADYESLGSTV
ncbi:hypothetical protein O5O45_26690 [Hahella aquimaris]|uniref:hypothetical protein n=1 Tax=Hahella sp. HNIBRBA332 TaxID=3015983 RepID=UPI00273C90ED|nr:hypothetical protein [Hahella sp. HNIBRBA332]WLQ13315.1 hypothetical protein O5O45_26690 [Hahella sp. HNIBRBA332]